MDGKKEDGYLLGVSPRETTPPRSTLAQLAEERLGSLQYLLQPKTGAGVTSSPSRTNRPRASTASTASTGGAAGRAAAGRVRRSASGNVDEAAAEASAARSRGLLSSAPNSVSRERPRSQGSRRQSSSKSNSNSTYRLSIDNNLERAPMGSNSSDHVEGGSSPSASTWRQRPQPPPSSSNGSTPERGTAEAAGLAAPRQARGTGGGVSTGLSATAAVGGGGPARKLSGGSFYSYGGSDRNSRGSYGGVGILEKRAGGDDNDSFFGYSDDDDGGGENDGGEGSDGGADGSGHRRRRLQNSCCILVGVSWAAALLLLLLPLCGGDGAASAWSTAATLEAATGCALVGVVVLAALARFWGLPAWSPREDECEDKESAFCCLWGRGREVDEGGKLAEIGGVTYLAI